MIFSIFHRFNRIPSQILRIFDKFNKSTNFTKHSQLHKTMWLSGELYKLSVTFNST